MDPLYKVLNYPKGNDSLKPTEALSLKFLKRCRKITKKNSYHHVYASFFAFYFVLSSNIRNFAANIQQSYYIIMIKAMILAAAALTMSATAVDAQTMIEKNNIKVENHLMTPEVLWAMGRIGAAEASPNGKQIVYQVGY